MLLLSVKFVCLFFSLYCYYCKRWVSSISMRNVQWRTVLNSIKTNDSLQAAENRIEKWMKWFCSCRTVLLRDEVLTYQSVHSDCSSLSHWQSIRVRRRSACGDSNNWRQLLNVPLYHSVCEGVGSGCVWEGVGMCVNEGQIKVRACVWGGRWGGGVREGGGQKMDMSWIIAVELSHNDLHVDALV